MAEEEANGEQDDELDRKSGQRLELAEFEGRELIKEQIEEQPELDQPQTVLAVETVISDCLDPL